MIICEILWLWYSSMSVEDQPARNTRQTMVSSFISIKSMRARIEVTWGARVCCRLPFKFRPHHDLQNISSKMYTLSAECAQCKIPCKKATYSYWRELSPMHFGKTRTSYETIVSMALSKWWIIDSDAGDVRKAWFVVNYGQLPVTWDYRSCAHSLQPSARHGDALFVSYTEYLLYLTFILFQHSIDTRL